MDLEKLKSISTAKAVKKGTILIREGDTETASSMYIVLKGQVTVSKNFRQNNAVQLAKLGSGDFVGEMSLFLSESRTATAVATEDSIVLEITNNNVYEILSSNPEFAYSMMVTLCERVQSANKKIKP